MAAVTTTPTIVWVGKSGVQYTYWIYPIRAPLAAKGGNYIFSKQGQDGLWYPLYIGQTGNLSERFDDHHKAARIIGAGATHIHARLNAEKTARLAEESDLVSHWRPSCNG